MPGDHIAYSLQEVREVRQSKAVTRDHGHRHHDRALGEGRDFLVESKLSSRKPTGAGLLHQGPIKDLTILMGSVLSFGSQLSSLRFARTC
jgi:hypothetical protein